MALTAFAEKGVACSFHFYQPPQTVIDQLVGNDRVVLARTAPENPFRYRVEKILSGGARTAAEIPHLVDSVTRRRLQQDPAGGVLFVFDSSERKWVSLGYADPAFQAIIDRVIAERSDWRGAFDHRRLSIAEALQDHPDRRMRELALQELDRAPYAMLRTVTLRLPSKTLLQGLWSMQSLPYLPIRVLLLGLSRDDAARAEIRRRIRQWADADTAAYLGVYATALVEIDGAEGIGLLEKLYFAPDAAQSSEKLEAVIEALAIHRGVGGADRKRQIRGALVALLARRPETAAILARQLGSRRDGSPMQALPLPN